MKQLVKTLILHSLVIALIIPIQYSVQSPTEDQKSLRSSSGMENPEEFTSDDDDYPSDTHGGAVKAFSQLVSSDDSIAHSSLSISSRASANINDLNNVEGKEDIGTDAEYETTAGKKDKGDDESDANDDGHETIVKLLGGDEDDNDDGEIDTQYLLEEFYGYTYDEALDDDNNDEGGRNKNNNDFDD